MAVTYNPIFNKEAKDYFSAISDEGAVISQSQYREINKRITDLKNFNIWDKLERIFLPVWGIDEANRYCVKTQSQGTFVGDVTHSLGYVSSSTRSGYFDTNISPADIFSLDSMYVCGYRHLLTGGNNDIMGCYDSFASSRIIIRSGDGPPNLLAAAWHYYNDIVIVTTSPVRRGIFSLSINGDTGSFYQRRRDVRSILGSYTLSNTGTIPVNNLYAMASNQNGTAGVYDNSQFGFWIIGQGLTNEEDEYLTLTMKLLWETLTGISLAL